MCSQNLNDLEEFKMEGEELFDVTLIWPIKKCSHYNQGYSKYMKKGCKLLHPQEVCIVLKCKSEDCPKIHPKHSNIELNISTKKMESVPTITPAQLWLKSLYLISQNLATNLIWQWT